VSGRAGAVVLAVIIGLAAPAAAQGAALDAYRVKATPANLKILAERGFDLSEGRDLDAGTIDVVGTPAQVGGAKLDAKRLTHNRTATRRAGAPTDGADDSPYTVWTKYDAVPDDDKEQYTEQYDRLVADNPGLVARRVVGTTYGGRDIVALQVTKDATGGDIAGRPAVLYNAMQHAREWLAGETCRRTLEYFVSNYGKGTSAGIQVTHLVDTRELWFVCVNNPDGYEFTFTPGNRLWRKNLRDNNNDGVIGLGDGVDPNRNFAGHWGLDNEGSSSSPEVETYRGPSAASEPETKAMEALFAEIHPVFQKNDHTAAELLLYPQGFQQDTPTADHEIFTALAGDPFKPGIEGFLPELSAGLYITNGDFTDWAYNNQGTLSFTPEGTSAEDTSVTGFEYPDSPLQVQQEFRRHLPFALDLAESADDPSEPDSHLDNRADDFVVDAFAESYGDPQAVGAMVKRKLGDVDLRFKVNGGPTQIVPTAEYRGGKRYYTEEGVYYHRVRGFVVGTEPGDSVEAWFTAGGKDSAHFTYAAVSETTNPVLLLVNEDWSGKQPNPAPLGGPTHLQTYRAALDAAGVQYDVYDVDAHARRAPHALGILSHYSHVVWETGDDYVPREADAPGGSGMTKSAVVTQNAVRDFLNDGGKLFFTGRNAGRPFAEGYSYNPFQEEEHTYCQDANPTCIISQDDFLQYWLGAYRRPTGGGEDADGIPFAVSGTVAPFDDFEGTPENSTDDDYETGTLLVTSSVLDPERFPTFAGSKAMGAWVRPFASPFDPHTGDWFVSAGTDDAAYKRLLKPFDLTGQSSATFDFWTSFDTESDYDYIFVEIHTVGQDDWTTLADDNGHTSQDVGLSCPTTGDGSNWQSIHPFLAHYQTIIDNGDDCTPTGTSGEWNAATGNSGGWQNWSLPIPAAYLNKNVEISISVASDPAAQGLGAWVDDARMLDENDDPLASPDPSFESGLGGWTTPGPPGPAGPAGQSQVTGWERAQSAPFIETPIVTTPDTVYTGFGFERLSAEADRNTLMRDVFEFLGAPHKPSFNAPAPRTEGAPSGPPGGGPGGGGPGPGTRPGLVRRLLTAVFTPRQKLGTLRRRGLVTYVACDVGCRVRIDLRVPRAIQRRYRLPIRTIGSRTVDFGTTVRKVFKVKLSRSASRRLRRARGFALTARAVQTDATPQVTRTGVVRIRR
jgi:murein tripeptide amidase MpaA